jgi:RNA methyltransferase, TrmH family
LPVALGRRAPRITAVRALKTVKGRREQCRFAFEGATLLEEALGAGLPIEALYVTPRVYDESPAVRELDESGTPTFTIDDRAAAALSDVEAPSGIFAVAPMRRQAVPALFGRAGLVLVLADLNDPGNAGTLIRSAEAFGAAGVLFGSAGVDPYHPKVVRAAMGSLFRTAIGVGDAAGLEAAASALGVAVIGLAAGGSPIEPGAWPARCALVVGNERHGLGDWAAVCGRFVEVPMKGTVESLNAAVAGSIALYEAARKRT